jgi:O-antigen ligase
VASILVAVGCLYIVGLSVSRGALLATAIGITIALRRVLRRGFVPLLVFITFSGIMYTFGVFDQMTSHYTARGMEETGRMLVWPVVIERILSSPLVGVGLTNTATYIPGSRKPIEAHNGFLAVALASGILPFALLVAWWIQVTQKAFTYSERLADGPFQLPFLVYTFVTTVIGDLAFMGGWGAVTFASIMASSPPYGVRHLVAPRVETGRMAQRSGYPAEARALIAHRRR